MEHLRCVDTHVQLHKSKQRGSGKQHLLLSPAKVDQSLASRQKVQWTAGCRKTEKSTLVPRDSQNAAEQYIVELLRGNSSASALMLSTPLRTFAVWWLGQISCRALCSVVQACKMHGRTHVKGKVAVMTLGGLCPSAKISQRNQRHHTERAGVGQLFAGWPKPKRNAGEPVNKADYNPHGLTFAAKGSWG